MRIHKVVAPLFMAASSLASSGVAWMSFELFGQSAAEEQAEINGCLENLHEDAILEFNVPEDCDGYLGLFKYDENSGKFRLPTREEFRQETDQSTGTEAQSFKWAAIAISAALGLVASSTAYNKLDSWARAREAMRQIDLDTPQVLIALWERHPSTESDHGPEAA